MDISDQDLADAFNAAHAAGKTEDATMFANEISRRLAGGGQPAAAAAQPARPYSPTPAGVSVDESGNVYKLGPVRTEPPADTMADQWSPDVSPEHSQQVLDAYNKMPWYMQIPQAGEDMARKGISGFSSGLPNHLAADTAYFTGGDPVKTYREQEQADADAGIRAGWAGTGAEVGGMLAGPGKLMKGEELATRMAPKVVNAVTGSTVRNPIVRRTLIRMGMGGVENATLNAFQNMGHNKDPWENAGIAGTIGAGAAGIAGPVIGALGGGALKWGANKLALDAGTPAGTGLNALRASLFGRKAAEIPPVGDATDQTNATLYGRKNRAYAPLDANQEPYHPATWQNAFSRLYQDAHNAISSTTLWPHMKSWLDDLAQQPQQWSSNAGGPIWSQLDALRREAMNRVSSLGAEEGKVAGVVRDHINDFIANNRTVRGTDLGAQDASARELHRQLQHGILAETAITNANAAARGNIDKLRTTVGGMVNPNGAGFHFMNPDEVSALTEVSRGTPVTRTADYFAHHPYVAGTALTAPAAAAAHLMSGPAASAAVSGITFPAGMAGSAAAHKYVESATNAAMDTARRVMTNTPRATQGAFQQAIDRATRSDTLKNILYGIGQNVSGQ